VTRASASTSENKEERDTEGGRATRKGTTNKKKMGIKLGKLSAKILGQEEKPAAMGFQKGEHRGREKNDRNLREQQGSVSEGEEKSQVGRKDGTETGVGQKRKRREKRAGQEK